MANKYDPNIAPDPAEWLALDEQERIELVEQHHRRARVKLPNRKAHAIFHAIVENQIAEGLDSVVRAMTRLMNEGLSRHEAVHAVGSVIAEYLFEAMHAADKHDPATVHAQYNAAVERLNVKSWLQHYGANERDG